MKLIDRIMRDICDVMKWQGWPDAPTEAGTWAGDIRIMLTPRCDAVDAVVTAAREYLNDECYDCEFADTMCMTGKTCEHYPMRFALAALDEVRE